MNQKDLIRVEPIALMPVQGGCAIFLGDGAKVVHFFIDPAIGASINAVLAGQAPDRPLSHDFFLMTLDAFGGKPTRCVIYDKKEEVFFARVIFEGENEIMQKKIIEIDARPSDCIAVCVRCQAPIYMAAKLWHSLPNVSKTLEDIRKQAEE